jgi:CDP-diglyceride synthetase
MTEFKLLILLLVANGAPVLAWDLLQDRFALPVDLGLNFIDGRPLLGPSKTWRGVFASLAATSLCALALGFSWQVGVTVGGGAMAGDVFASFIKRRLGVDPSERALGLDQIPESLFPLALVKAKCHLDLGAILQLIFLFSFLELTLSPVLYRLGLRKRPY